MRKYTYLNIYIHTALSRSHNVSNTRAAGESGRRHLLKSTWSSAWFEPVTIGVVNRDFTSGDEDKGIVQIINCNLRTKYLQRNLPTFFHNN